MACGYGGEWDLWDLKIVVIEFCGEGVGFRRGEKGGGY